MGYAVLEIRFMLLFKSFGAFSVANFSLIKQNKAGSINATSLVFNTSCLEATSRCTHVAGHGSSTAEAQ